MTGIRLAGPLFASVPGNIVKVSWEGELMSSPEQGAAAGLHAGCVFLSHTGCDDAARDLAVHMWLNLKGDRKVFFDQDSIGWGDDNSAMLDAIRSCGVFVPIISPSYLDREWPLRELHEALCSDKVVVRAVCVNMDVTDVVEWARTEKAQEALSKYELALTPSEVVSKLKDQFIMHEERPRNSKVWAANTAPKLVEKLLNQQGHRIADIDGRFMKQRCVASLSPRPCHMGVQPLSP